MDQGWGEVMDKKGPYSIEPGLCDLTMKTIGRQNLRRLSQNVSNHQCCINYDMRTREKPLKRKYATPECNTNIENRDRFSYEMSVISTLHCVTTFTPHSTEDN